MALEDAPRPLPAGAKTLYPATLAWRRDIGGKVILLYCETGLGDTLQFCRFAKMVRALGATVLLQVQPALVELLGALEGVSQVVTEAAPPPPFDVHCPILSLPLALSIKPATIPAGAYLCAPPGRVARWRAELGTNATPRIGLIWRGDPHNPDDHKRSLPLAQLLAHLPKGLRYVGLQKEMSQSEQQLLGAHPNRFEKGRELNFIETAALCECLDLVIGVDTSIAHLSGALGQKTWIVLPSNPDCRWLLDRTDSPWYASVRLYRQARSGDWAEVLTRVASDLERLFAARMARPD